MKTFHSLTQHLQWRRTYPPRRRMVASKVSEEPASNSYLYCQKQRTALQEQHPQEKLPLRNANDLRPMHRVQKNCSSLMLVLAVISLTSVTGYRFYNQPKLDVGKKAPETIVAPFDARFEDTKTTEEKRKKARSEFAPVLMFDASVNQEIYQKLEEAIAQGNEIRSPAGSFPFIKNSVLSNSSQLYLRQAPEWEWRTVLLTVNTTGDIKQTSLTDVANKPLDPAFAVAVTELQSYRRLTSPQAFSTLLEIISFSRQRYASTVVTVQPQIDWGSPYDISLLDLSNEAWKQTQKGIYQAAQRILTQGIPPGLPASILQQAVKTQVSSSVPAEAEAMAMKLLMGVLRPNLTEDQEQTQQQAEKAAEDVKPEMVAVRQGEVIVHADEAISQADFVLLDNFGLSRRGINWHGLLGFGGIVTGAVGIFLLVEQRVYRIRAGTTLPMRRRDYLLILLLSLSTPLLGTFGANYTNLPAIGWLVGSFYGPALGITVVGLLTGLVASSITIQVCWIYLVAGAAGGILAAMMTARMRSREELALLGSGVGLTQGVVYLILKLTICAATGSIGYAVIKEAVLYGLSALAWSVVALGISPYLEHLFDLLTPIRLAELANPNRPLLKRLVAETPGTFQHTLFVANLAEAAARELGCNVELVRAGTLYHDIGKMHDPLGFIENQMGGPNKHDQINDPWKSAAIIKKHVSEGLVMASRHRLPKAIQAFIPEHQGTILIAYFYHQAQQLALLDPTISVQDEDFRYDGPIPQSRETGIVMLADASEAALRSLKDATPETALSTINKILRARWQEGQLADSGLTRQDLSTMAEIFVQVWQQSNHQRIAYPKAVVSGKL